MWTCSREPVWILGVMFGPTSSPIDRNNQFSRCVLYHVLQNQTTTGPVIPTKDEFDPFVASIGEKYPRLAQKKVYGTMDGVKFYLQQARNIKIQENFYNGWKHDCYVTNFFMFTPDGMIRLMVINLPDDTHDSAAAKYGFIYKKLEGCFKKYVGKCVVDSDFSLLRKPYLLKSSRTDVTSKDAYGMMLNAKATSMRQMAEWGMC
eukprot:5424931-Ditylum_brightwellii.AAC.1